MDVHTCQEPTERRGIARFQSKLERIQRSSVKWKVFWNGSRPGVFTKLKVKGLLVGFVFNAAWDGG